MQHLGLAPWDVISVALYQKLGLSIGTWTVLTGIFLIILTLIMRGKHINIGTFLNTLLLGPMLDFFLWTDMLPDAGFYWVDYLWLVAAIAIMGTGGGLYVSGGIGAGPRDGFMLTISDRTLHSVRKTRIIVESLAVGIGFILGGPVFIVTFLYTFIQSPIFQLSLKVFTRLQRGRYSAASGRIIGENNT